MAYFSDDILCNIQFVNIPPCTRKETSLLEELDRIKDRIDDFDYERIKAIIDLKLVEESQLSTEIVEIGAIRTTLCLRLKRIPIEVEVNTPVDRWLEIREKWSHNHFVNFVLEKMNPEVREKVEKAYQLTGWFIVEELRHTIKKVLTVNVFLSSRHTDDEFTISL